MYKDITTAKNFIPFKDIISFGEFEAIGYFPYETARIQGVKVPRTVYQEIDNTTVKDNKVVVVFKDKVHFGTDNFAIFFHDLGAIIGEWEDIKGYDCDSLKYKDI